MRQKFEKTDDRNAVDDQAAGTAKAAAKKDRSDGDKQTSSRSTENKMPVEQRIFRISIAGSIIFLAVEIVLAKITGSRSVLMDCVYDIADMVMLAPFLLLVPKLYQPETEKHPFGYAQVESLFILIKTGLLTIITADMVVSNIRIMLHGGNQVDAVVVAVYECSISACCFVMYLILHRLNKKAGSPSVDTEIYIWKLDALSTLSVGAAFFMQVVFMKIGWTVIVPYIDPGVAVVLGIILLREPVSMFIEALRDLVLFAPGQKTRDRIREVTERCLSKYGYRITAIETIRTGRRIWVEVYLIPDGDVLYMHQMKEVCVEAGRELRQEYPELWVEFIPDFEHQQEKLVRDQEFFGRVAVQDIQTASSDEESAQGKETTARQPDRKKAVKQEKLRRKTVRK